MMQRLTVDFMGLRIPSSHTVLDCEPWRALGSGDMLDRTDSLKDLFNFATTYAASVDHFFLAKMSNICVELCPDRVLGELGLD